MAKSLWGGLFGWATGKAAESRRFGRYLLIKVIHEGEKGAVHQARSPDDGDLYAVKVYKPLYNRTARRICKRYSLRTEGEVGLFLNTSDASAAEDYPIVRTFEYGWEFGDSTRCYYLVQEFVEGVNAKHLVGCDDPLLQERRVDIALVIGRALSIVHDRGLVHRDVCTDNIILRKDGRVKLIDLGFMVPDGLKFQEKSGTPSYMSPEQFEAKPLHAASDIYSFGVVLYELFTKQLPFTSRYSSKTAEQIMRRTTELKEKHLKETPPRPTESGADVPDGVEEIVLKCLEKSPEKRYPTMRHVLSDLAGLRESESGGGSG